MSSYKSFLSTFSPVTFPRVSIAPPVIKFLKSALRRKKSHDEADYHDRDLTAREHERLFQKRIAMKKDAMLNANFGGEPPRR